MNEIGKGFDGSIEKAIESTGKLNEFPEFLQRFITLGDGKLGLVKKVDGTKLGADKNGKDIQDYTSKIVDLDEAQQNAILSVTQFGDKSEDIIRGLIKEVQEYQRVNGKTFESKLKSWDSGEIMTGDVNSLMGALNMKNGDSYARLRLKMLKLDLTNGLLLPKMQMQNSAC